MTDLVLLEDAGLELGAGDNAPCECIKDYRPVNFGIFCLKCHRGVLILELFQLVKVPFVKVALECLRVPICVHYKSVPHRKLVCQVAYLDGLESCFASYGIANDLVC